MSTTKNANRKDVYTRITDKVIADLEQGVRPWIMNCCNLFDLTRL